MRPRCTRMLDRTTTRGAGVPLRRELSKGSEGNSDSHQWARGLGRRSRHHRSHSRRSHRESTFYLPCPGLPDDLLDAACRARIYSRLGARF
jgi:hypothetical protein